MQRPVDEQGTPSPSDAAPFPSRGFSWVVVPVVGFAALVGLFAFALTSGDPSRLPSALLGKPVPPEIPWHEIEPTMSAMARSFYSENRRVRNDRLKRELGVVLRYPTYREGLRAIAALG